MKVLELWQNFRKVLESWLQKSWEKRNEILESPLKSGNFNSFSGGNYEKNHLKEWFRQKLSCSFINLHMNLVICTYLFFLKIFSIDHI